MGNLSQIFRVGYTSGQYYLAPTRVGQTRNVQLGISSSASDGYGFPLNSKNTAAFRVYADTGSAALTTGTNTRAAQFRYLIGYVPTAGADLSTYGAECQVKTIVSANVGGNQGGVLGHYESSGTITLTGSINTVKAGVASFLDLSSTTTVAAATVVSAFGVNPANFSGTITGRRSIIHVTNPMASTWDCFLDLSSATGCVQDSAAGATPGKHLKIYLNGVLHTVATVTA